MTKRCRTSLQTPTAPDFLVMRPFDGPVASSLISESLGAMPDPTPSAAVLFEIAETPHRPGDDQPPRSPRSSAVAVGLEEAVERVEAAPDLRVAILTGAGPHAFCAGADLKTFPPAVAPPSTKKGGFGGFVRATRTKLWIAAAQGYALAGGLELLLSCDLSVVAETANFGLPEVKRSLVAGAGGVFRLPRALPKAIALEMIATGDPIPAARALQFGLVNTMVPAAQVIATALALARLITVNAPIAVRESLGVARPDL